MTVPVNEWLITGSQIIGQRPTPRNRNERTKDNPPPRLSGMAVAPKACNATDMQPMAPPARAQKIPRVMGPAEKTMRLERTTRPTAAIKDDFWNPILSIFPPQMGLKMKFEKAPPIRISPAFEPDTLNSSRATTATRTLTPMGPAATMRVANPMRMTFRCSRFLNDSMLEI